MCEHLRYAIAIIIITFVTFISMGQSALAAPFTVSDDPNTGSVSVENNIYKAVWQYKTNPAQNNNQSGGNLFGLYFKATDPLAQNNLVAVANYGNSNSVIWAGVGGSGQTAMYAADSPPGSPGTYSWNDLIGDNNLSGILLGHSVQQDSNGAINISFTFNVINQSTDITWYQVTKNWIAYPDGHLELGISRKFLRSGYISEPRTTFTWNKNGGWTSFEKYGYGWGQNQSESRLVTINGIENVDGETWNALNMFYPLWVRLAGSSTAPDITVEATGGFQSSGLYSLGQAVWNGPPGATMEQSVYSNPSPQVTAYAMAWMGWWGGNPPDGSRYRLVPSQTTITDNYQITLGQQPAEMQNLPQVSNINIAHIGANDATLSWTTNIPSGSIVNYATSGQTNESTVIAPGLTTQHSVHVSGLASSSSYRYTVGDSSSMAVQGGGQFDTLGTGTGAGMTLTVTLDNAHWSSYQDYQNRILAVSYFVTNDGTNNMQSAIIMDNRLSAGVVNMTLPVHLGSLSAGQTTTFEISYRVPSGIALFQSQLSGLAEDAQGNSYPFPA